MASTYRTMQAIAYDAIREGILEGRYPPGQRLAADELAKELGVSRMPVREALHRLQESGLVTSVPHRGTVVSALSKTEIVEIYHIRAVLEGLGARLAVPNLTGADYQCMIGLLDELDRLTSVPDFDRILQLNYQFHKVIWQAARAPRLLALMENLHDASRRFRRTSLLLPGRLHQISEEHHQILDGLTQRDADMAELWANKHHEITAELLLNSLEKEPPSGLAADGVNQQAPAATFSRGH